MKKFFTVTLAVIAAFIFVSCSDGKNLEDLIEVPDTDDTADASETPDQNGTDKDSDKDGDKDDDTTSCPDEINDPTNPTDEPTNPTDEPTNPTDDPTNPTDEPTNPTDEPTNPTDEPTNPTDDVEPTNDDDPTNPTNDVEPTDDDDPTNPKDDVDPIDDDDPTNPTNDIDPTDDDDPTNDDDPTTPTDPFEKCTEITLVNTELTYYKHSHGSEKYDIFKATYTPNTGSATSDTFYLKFYGLSEYDYTTNFNLAEINQGSDRGLFLSVHEDEYCDSYSGDCTHGKTYFQKAGTVKVISAEFNFTTSKIDLLSAELNGVVLEETGTNESKACLKIKDTKAEYHGYYY